MVIAAFGGDGSSAVSFTVLFISFVFGFYFLLIRKSRAVKLLGKVPGPSTIPLLGNALEIKPGAALLPLLIKWRNMFGTRFVFWLATDPYLVISNANDVEKLLSSNVHIEKSKDYEFLKPWLGTGLLTSLGKKWFHRRKTLTPAFHFKILEEFLPIINEQTQVLVDVLNESFADGKVFDVFPYITRCALDIICETAMGKKINAQRQTDSDYVRALYRISDLIQHRQLTPWLWPDFIWSICPSGREEKKLLKILHGFTVKVIEERKEQRKARKTGEVKTEENTDDMFLSKKRRLAFLDLLLESQEKEGIANFSDFNIREETDTFMFEGHDTTAANANWTTFLLGCDIECQKKVHEELDSVFGSDRKRPVTMEDMTKLKYLECCIKESLRLYPSVPFLARSINTDFQLDDKTIIPPGTTALVQGYELNRDPEVFPNPEKFDPERFTNENSSGRHPYAYVPFSAGPRNCIGQKFAIMEEKVLLANLFRNFSVESIDKREEITLLTELILRPQDGLRIKISPRK